MRSTKATALFASFAALPLLLAAATGSFGDVAGTRHEASINLLAEQGVVEGYADGTFRPDARINRAEFLKILMEARYAELETPKDLQCFSDLMVRVPQWYARPVCLARQLGIVGGYPDGTFRPGKDVNLAEALKIALLAFDVQAGQAAENEQWFEPYLRAARDRGILMDLLKTPDHVLTRGEMAAIAAGLLAPAETGSSSSASDEPPVCGNNRLEKGEQCDDGNVQNSDGCSMLCIIVPEPVRLAVLQVDAQASGTVTNVARGKTGVPLLRFNATVDRQDAFFNGAAFMPSVGSLAYAQNYVLAMDGDGDGRFETKLATGKAQGSRLTFEGIKDLRLKENVTVRMEVRADVASTTGPVSLGLQFATSEPDYIRATGAVDGTPLQGIETDNACPGNVSVCFIRVNTRASTDITVQTRGNLYVTADSLPVRSQQVLGGSISDPLLRLRMRADGEDLDVKTIRIDGGAGSIDSLRLFKVAPGASIDTRTAQPFAEATNGQCPTVSSTRFCANLSLNMLRIAANQEMTVVVAAKAKDEQGGAIGGQTFALMLTAAADASHAVEARGVSSLAELNQNDGNAFAEGEVYVGTAAPGASSAVVGPLNDTVLGKILSVSNAMQQSTATGIPSGKQTIGGFVIGASAHTNTFHGSNDVIVNTMAIQVTAQNVQIDPAGYRLYNPENPAVGIACSAPADTGTFTVTCSGIAGSVIQSRIGQGQQAKYMLEAVVTNTQVSQGESRLVTELKPLGQRDQTNAIIWSDEATTLQWVDIPALGVQSTQYWKP